MKIVNTSICMLAITTLLFGCQQNFKNESEASVGSSKNYISTKPKEPNERQFIHTASLNMNTKNCLQATNQIEGRAIVSKGFLLKSSVQKNINKETETSISVDSIKRISYYTMNADLVVRVPDTSLQNFLLYTQSLGDNVKIRLITATDVTFDLKLNELNLAEGIAPKNISKTSDNENKIEVLPPSKNEMYVNDLKMKDEVNFSTIEIKLQQPEALEIQTVVNNNASWAKEMSLASKAWLSMQKGYYYFTCIILLVLQFWWILPIFFVSKYVFSKKYFMHFQSRKKLSAK